MIRTGKLQVGDSLPTYASLCQKLGLSYVTVKRGMDLLEAEGLIRRVRSQGTFVAKKLSACGRDLKKLGLVFPGSRELLFRLNYLSEIVRGILIETQPMDIDVHIFSMASDGVVQAAKFAEAGVDGVLLLDVENDDYLRKFAKWETPGVVVDYLSQAAPLDYLACDNACAAARMLDHLLGLGHRRIAYVERRGIEHVHTSGGGASPTLLRKSSDVAERRESVVASAAARGLGPRVLSIVEGGADKPTALESLVEAWRSAPSSQRPTAFLGYDELEALTLIGLFAEAGVRVPRDVSVCAVAGAGDAIWKGHSLTYCRFDFVGMGREAVRLLAERCNAPGLERCEFHRIGFSFIEGATTATPGLRRAAAPRS